MLEARDYTLIIDKSGSMSMPDRCSGKSRWQAIQESTFALAHKCEQFDPDGITVYTFSGRFKRYDNVTANKVSQIFQENKPSGRTDLAGVLRDALQSYFHRKGLGKAKASGETILVVTDGEPNDRNAVIRAIVEASRQIESARELAITFIQVGRDPEATRFLKLLDDELQSTGAYFDIVETIPIDDMPDLTLTEVLIDAIMN
jgi:uncharacterized protein with von Willebrand factor type A (vWA) domain